MNQDTKNENVDIVYEMKLRKKIRKYLKMMRRLELILPSVCSNEIKAVFNKTPVDIKSKDIFVCSALCERKAIKYELLLEALLRKRETKTDI